MKDNPIPTHVPGPRLESPFTTRIRLLWAEMRDQVLSNFPKAPGLPTDVAETLKRAEDNYAADAYHSLSIEGYRVTPELIDRVRSGAWNPETSPQDMGQRDALAARGYSNAHAAVIASLHKVLSGKNPGLVAQEDHGSWYRDLFSPSVAAGILRPTDLAGYRSAAVYISQSTHVPPAPHAVRDAMPAFFELLANEPDPAALPVLGHFFFVHIHPYSDGNGRIGRFLMNLLMVAGGYPWTIAPVQQRGRYMSALEQASSGHDILPFTKLIAELVESPLPDL